MLILECVVVLVRVVHLLDRADLAFLRDDVEPLADRVVEPRDLALEQLEVDVGQLHVRRQQAEAVV